MHYDGAFCIITDNGIEEIHVDDGFIDDPMYASSLDGPMLVENWERYFEYLGYEVYREFLPNVM